MSVFAEGDRVIISDTPVDEPDKRYSRKVGTVESEAHQNRGQTVYRVLLDDKPDYGVLLYEQDLIPYDELADLRVRLVEAEEKLVALKKAIKLKERDASVLPLATVVAYKDTFGPAAITKQSEDSWLNVFPTSSGNSDVETLTDKRVTQLLSSNANAVVRKP